MISIEAEGRKLMAVVKIKRRLVIIWNLMFDIKDEIQYQYKTLIDRVIRLFNRSPKVMTIDQTLDEILNNNASICRYGDGEFKLMMNSHISFQQANENLAERLRAILKADEPGFLVCLPDVFEELSQFHDEPRNYWSRHLSNYRLQWYRLLSDKKVYYNSFLSRCYYPFQNKSESQRWFNRLKLIWLHREVVIIEGKKSRLGVGNDLFERTNSIERILVPEENAFNAYDQIIVEAKKVEKHKLILLAIGPTATVMAYDLYKEGYQAIDIGHVDIEYEWYLRGALTKISIANKYVCEAGGGKGVGESQDSKYLKEIKCYV